ncbi:adhesin [Levilactobacillus brevis]|nr:adhesin [Levilactobacillus brevis]
MATQRPAYVHVDQDNFTQYFDLNGSATYDKPTGIVTVTPDKNDQVGNFALKPKIDGIGFAFHNGNSTDIGNAGDNLGIGGLIDALGLKLDTWHNGAHMPEALRSGAQVSTTDANGYG